MRNLLSKTFQPLSLIPHNSVQAQNEAKKLTEISSKSARMLVDHGFIRASYPGAFTFLPLAMRSMTKLTNLIDSRMRQIGGQKILLPTLTEGRLWKQSGRWSALKKENDGHGELLTLKNRNDQDLVFGPTYEEAITDLLADLGHLSFRSLPLRLYQISTKYRDEGRPKFGLIRGREFIMKDMYTFDTDLKSAQETYNQVVEVYEAFFKEDLGIPFVKVKGDTGAIGGHKSHEFHFPCNIGQDELLICQNCGRGRNTEVAAASGDCCDNPNILKRKGIEVGHTFLLGDKYSKVFKGCYANSNGKPELYQMGCYGLGVSRILAAAAESMSKSNELIFPKSIAPYKIAILAPKKGSKEAAATENVFKLYDQLDAKPAFKDDVIIDDRDKLTIGKKLREAKMSGYTWVLVFGKNCIDSSDATVELHTSTSESVDEEVLDLPVNQVLSHFETIHNHKLV